MSPGKNGPKNERKNKMRTRSIEKKSFVAFGVDFNQIPHGTKETWDKIIKNAVEDLRDERARELDPRTPRNPERPYLSSPAERQVIVVFARNLGKK